MALKYTPYLVPLFVTAIISIILAIYGWRRRHAPGAIPFILLMLLVALWSLSYGFELGSTGLKTKEFWAKIEYLGIVGLPVAWLLFALKYTGRDEWSKLHKIVLMLVVPLATLSLVWTNDLHGLIWNTLGLYNNGLPQCEFRLMVRGSGYTHSTHTSCFCWAPSSSLEHSSVHPIYTADKPWVC